MSWLQTILGFGFLIFVHELGHFAVARWCGVRCPQFAIGFGQALLAWRKGMGLRTGTTEKEYTQRAVEALEKARGTPFTQAEVDALKPEAIMQAADELGLGATEYRLNWMPLGGYVKMLGQEDMDPAAASQDPASFNKQKPWKRALILVAGVTMNAVFGALLFIAAASLGEENPTNRVGVVLSDSPAAEAGLQPGDVITHVNGRATPDFIGVRHEVALAPQGQCELTVKRDGETLALKATARANKDMRGLRTLGISSAPTLAFDKPILAGPLAGVPEGSRITAANGQALNESWRDFSRAFENSQGKPVALTLTLPDGATQQHDVQPAPSGSESDTLLLGLRPVCGVAQVHENSPAEQAGLQSGDLLAGIRIGNDTTLRWPSTKRAVSAIHENKELAPIALTVWRGGQEVALKTVKPQRKGGLLGLVGGTTILGFAPMEAWHSRHLAADQSDDCPWRSLPGLTPGATLEAVNGQPLTNLLELPRLLSQAEAGKPLTLSLRPTLAGAEPADIGAMPAAAHLAALETLRWSLPLEASALSADLQLTQADSLGQAVTMGLQRTEYNFVLMGVTLKRLLTGEIGLKALSGPLGIVGSGKHMAERGWGHLMAFLAMLSINLAVLNLLPLPILDGGHLVLLGLEKIRGKPLGANAMAAIGYVGLLFIGGLFLYITLFNDIGLGRLFGG